jgi:hypothetical protein
MLQIFVEFETPICISNKCSKAVVLFDSITEETCWPI